MEFLQRLDAIVVYTLLITVFFKAAIYLYGALIGIVDLFNLKNHQQILLPIGVILIFFSIVLSATFAEQTEEGILVHYIAIVLLIIIPLLMLLVSLIRNRFKKAKDEKGKSESSAT
jgi:spore germination protein KB